MRVAFLILMVVAIATTLTACERVSNPYVMKMDRQDQDLRFGNKGYLKGTPPPGQDRTGIKREFIALDIDLITPNIELAEGGTPSKTKRSGRREEIK